MWLIPLKIPLGIVIRLLWDKSKVFTPEGNAEAILWMDFRSVKLLRWNNKWWAALCSSPMVGNSVHPASLQLSWDVSGSQIHSCLGQTSYLTYLKDPFAVLISETRNKLVANGNHFDAISCSEMEEEGKMINNLPTGMSTINGKFNCCTVLWVLLLRMSLSCINVAPCWWPYCCNRIRGGDTCHFTFTSCDSESDIARSWRVIWISGTDITNYAFCLILWWIWMVFVKSLLSTYPAYHISSYVVP